MAEEKPIEKTSKKGCRPVSIVFAILGALLVIFAIWCFYRFWWSSNIPALVKISPSPSSQFTRTSPKQSQGSGKVDSALVGTWNSDCLVPDQDSPWSERHQFVINADGTAIHTRWSNDTMSHDCSPSGTPGTLVNSYTISIPSAGQIDLTDTSGAGTMYDIYQVSSNTLMFGHGFRGDNSSYSGLSGGSAGERITSLNTFIVYRK